MRKKAFVGCSVLIAILSTLIAISYSSKIVNPFVGLKGMLQMSIGTEKVEKISDEPLMYISKSYDDFVKYMELEGYTVEQYCRGFNIQKGDDSKLLIAEGFVGCMNCFIKKRWHMMLSFLCTYF